jgi:hypothetical protein
LKERLYFPKEGTEKGGGSNEDESGFVHDGCFDGSLCGNPQRLAWGHKTVNTSMLHVILQAIPVLAAAGGVLYAALQFRGWRLSQYVANFTKLIELQLQIRKMVIDDPTLGPEGVPKEEVRGYYYNLIQLSLFEIAWYSHEYGQLTDDYFASWEVSMASIAKRPAFQAMWQSDRTKILHDGFRRYMERLMQGSP